MKENQQSSCDCVLWAAVGIGSDMGVSGIGGALSNPKWGMENSARPFAGLRVQFREAPLG